MTVTTFFVYCCCELLLPAGRSFKEVDGNGSQHSGRSKLEIVSIPSLFFLNDRYNFLSTAAVSYFFPPEGPTRRLMAMGPNIPAVVT